jgi:hypothetical protein
LLISWVGADDGATQSDSDFNNDSASDESSDSDEASRLSFESVRRPTIERPEREIVIEEETLAPAPALEAPDSEYKRSKKGKKKSKISAAQAVFEEE